MSGVLAIAWGAHATTTADGQSQHLRETHAALAGQLQDNVFGEPLVIRSRQDDSRLRGDVYAVVAHPFDKVRANLSDPQRWCDVMLLHINTKYCRAVSLPEGGQGLRVHVGKKTPQPLQETSRLDFRYRTTTVSDSMLDVSLHAIDGPLGTSDYRMTFSAIPLDGDRSFVHLRYSYAVGFAGRVAMNAYLNTAGNDKVGFSPADAAGAGPDARVDGMRGVVERNAMRYYLAIDALLDNADVKPSNRQFEQRLDSWFRATEKYPRQLREVSRDEYVAMKRDEYRRQQQAPQAY